MKYYLFQTMILFIAASCSTKGTDCLNCEYTLGAITRADTSRRELALVFTGDEFADGADTIISKISDKNVQASFFFTGRYYRNTSFKNHIEQLVKAGHYLGAHSNDHLLYCDWGNRDSLLVTKEEFIIDLERNYYEMERFGVERREAKYFLPPYEWYNETISEWTRDIDLRLINYTYGTLSHADYTTPGMPGYRSSEAIFDSIREYEEANGLNGFILLMHIGTDPARTDKLYNRLDELIDYLHERNYKLVRIDELLETK